MSDDNTSSRGSSSSATAATIEVENLRVVFPVRSAGNVKQELTAVDGVSLSIAPGETLGLVGESGSGKTTLGQAILRLTPSTGRISLAGTDISQLPRSDMRKLRGQMQIIFQDPYSSLDPRQRIRQILAEPLAIHGLLPRAGREARVRELLELVGLRPDQANRYPHQLSGGQRQRVAVARALAVQPSFIVCDEPLSALDVSIQAQILNLLVELRERLGLTYLFIGHDLAVMRYVSDRIAVMYLGRIVEIGPPEELFSGAFHPYTRALVSALPMPDPVSERERQRVVVTGDLPSPITPPSGCRFHTRCWLYQQLDRPAKCSTEQPELVERSGNRWAACHFSSELAGNPVGVVNDTRMQHRHVPVPIDLAVPIELTGARSEESEVMVNEG